MERGRGTNEEWDGIRPVRPPAGLSARILYRIRAEQKLAASRKRMAYFSIALGGSLATLGSTLVLLGGAFAQSGAWQTLSLLYSDPGTVLANWNNFSLFLLESLPVSELLIFLTVLFATLYALQRVGRYASVNFLSTKLVKN